LRELTPRLTRDQLPRGLHVGVGHYAVLFMGELTVTRECFEQSLASFYPDSTKSSYFALLNDI
jgi:hypothetical protein